MSNDGSVEVFGVRLLSPSVHAGICFCARAPAAWVPAAPAGRCMFIDSTKLSSTTPLLIHVFFNLNRVCKIGTPIALRLTYLMPEAASSFYTLLHVGKDANMISIDLTLVRRK